MRAISIQGVFEIDHPKRVFFLFHPHVSIFHGNIYRKFHDVKNIYNHWI